ncbi:hypothetical protein F2Q68_00010223 [Brassica cretica]|uniref:Uncharacterized protein n=1 Tax=Brassica cretica TaxID=69181 RepID=A0A8S9KNN9_BRACR|nr:hypothetical protein F2Q68_00010223 [Brassica cretica]
MKEARSSTEAGRRVVRQTINTQEAARQAAAELAAQQAEQQGAPIGERNLPRNFPTTCSAINPPPCTRQDYEIKRALIGLVQKKMFNIENFERVCNFSRANGVPPDYVKCTMFPFSLDGKEARWLASLPTGTFALIENMASSSLNKNKENDRSKSVNSIDDLAAKIDQLCHRTTSNAPCSHSLLMGKKLAG